MKILGKYLFLGLISFFLVSAVSMCKKDKGEALVGNWLERSDFYGDSRGDAVAFSVGNNAFVGTGYDGEDRLSDFFKYDVEQNNWTQIADFPGEPRQGAVAFSADGNGYVGTGYDGLVKYNDFWKYDPVSNIWEQVADFEGEARYGAVAFTINNIGYVGTGFSGNALMDFWAYDPASDTWEQKSNFQSKVYEAAAFTLNNKGYICTGWNNGVYSKDFYRYDPGTNVWTAMRKTANVSEESFDDNYTISRKKGVALVIGGKAYVTLGDLGNLKKDVWEYDPGTDLWTPRTNFEGATRTDAVAFTTQNGRGFVTTGLSSSLTFDDIWEFKPNDPYNEED